MASSPPEEEKEKISVYDIGCSLTTATAEMYEKILDKLGHHMTEQFLQCSSQEEKASFNKRLKETHIEKLTDRLTLILNKILTDYYFIKSYDEIMGSYKSIGELKQDNEIANNHLQSVENERSILQRDTDMAIDKLEGLCEEIFNNKYNKLL